MPTTPSLNHTELDPCFEHGLPSITLRRAKKALQISTSQVQWAMSPCVSELSLGKLLMAGLASEMEGQTSI